MVFLQSYRNPNKGRSWQNNGDGLDVRKLHRKEESRVCQQDLSPLGMESGREEKPQQVVCYRSVDYTEYLKEKRKTIDLKITLAYLVPTEMWFIVSQAVPARVGGRHKGIGWW